MKTKRIICMLISLMLILPVCFTETGKAEAFTETAYADIITASDFQASGITAFTRFGNILARAESDGLPTPDGALFGGDYATSVGVDPTQGTQNIKDACLAVYPGMSTENMVFVEGNHDLAGESLTPTGLRDMGEYLVYSINEDDFKTGQASRSNYDTAVKALAANVKAELDRLIKTGDRRPVFVITHVPLHHSSRSTYGDSFYSSYLFNVLNEAGKKLDIVFLFGHNHSGGYDNYIGGAVNYLAKGDNIRIPIPDLAVRGETGYTDETLNFTYMNCGYVGYSNNANDGTSVNTLTMGVIELCPETLEVIRYTESGVYSRNTINRVNPLPLNELVKISGNAAGETGCSNYLYCNTFNIDSPVFSWESDNEAVANVTGRGNNALIEYRSAGTATITASVTYASGTLSDTFEVTVGSGSSEKAVSLMNGTKNVNDSRIYSYSTPSGTKIYLEGTYTGYTDTAQVTWSSSNPDVISVADGVLTAVSNGSARIDYTVSEGINTLTSGVTVFVSNSPREVEYYLLSDSPLTAGKNYVIGSSATDTAAYAMVGEELTFGGKYNTRLVAQPVSVTQKVGTSCIAVRDDAIVWTAEEIGGEIYLRSNLNGRYLSAQSFAADEVYTSGRIELLMSSSDISPMGRCSVENGILRVGRYFPHMSSDGNFRANRGTAEQAIYELMPEGPFAALTMSGMSVDGSSFDIRGVTADSEMNLTGAFAGFNETAAAAWTSSDTTVADVNASGKVSFTGAQGDTLITYTVTDGVTSISKTVSLHAYISSTPTDVYVPADTLEIGKTYMIANTSAAGAAYAMTDRNVYWDGSNDSRFERRDITVNDVNGVPTVTSSRDSSVLWKTEGGENGEIYLKSENSGEYLRFESADADGLFTSGRKDLTLAASPDTSCACTMLNGFMKVGGVYYVYYSSEGNFRANSSCTQGRQQLFVRIKETSADISVDGVSVNGKNRTGTKGSSETLVGSYTCFSEGVSESWSSDSPGVATVENGTVSFLCAGSVSITYTVTDTLGHIVSCSVAYSVPEPPTEPTTEPITEPITETTTELPTETPTQSGGEQSSCTHMCHSENPAIRFFWKILCLFCKLFGVNRICECGELHY